MKKILLLLLLGAATGASAQSNSVKFTLSPGLIMANNLAFNYERKFADKFAINARLNFTSKKDLPLNGLATDLLGPVIDSAGVRSDILDTKTTSFGMNFQFKYFPAGKALKGFYIAPYLGFQTGKMQDFTFDFPDANDPTIKHGGTVEASTFFFGGGIGIGNQFVADNGLTLDIMWLGLGLGSNTVTLRGTDTSGDVDYQQINADVQQFATDNADDISTFKGQIDSEYSNSDINVFVKHPFPYVKILNFSIGYSF